MIYEKEDEMKPKCPMCHAVLNKQTDEGYVCEECDEVIPKQYADNSRPKCSCGCDHNELH